MWELRISVDVVRRKSKGDRAGVQEFTDILPRILRKPAAILIGIGRDDGPMEWGIAYCGKPRRQYRKDAAGTYYLAEVRENQLFVIYVDEHREIYDWGWEDCDPGDPVVPCDWREGRFKCRAR